MDIQTAIHTRRSIKHFDPNHRLTAAEIDQLMGAAIVSPTAFNIQHWRFVQICDPAQREAIYQASYQQAQVRDASLLLVVCADLNAWEKQPERYWANAPESVRAQLLDAIENYYTNHHQAQRDECIRSASLAAMSIMLMAKGMGYDTCPMDGFDFDRVAKLIQLPHDHIIVMMIALGKATQAARPRAGQLPLSEVFHTDRF